MRRFVLLESGPCGPPAPMCLDSLAPGFLLVFDLVPVLPAQDSMSDADVESVCQGSLHEPVAATRAVLSGATARSGSGGVARGDTEGTARSDNEGPVAHRSGGEPALRGSSDDDVAATLLKDSITQRLTSVLLGVSYEEQRAPSKDSAGGRASLGAGTVCWDVQVSGPHAHWAWRALLGSGAGGPTFASFRRNAAPSPSSKVEIANGSGIEWPVPPPTCVIATSSLHSGGPGAPSGDEFASHSWLFNGPQAANARGVFVPQGALQEAMGGGTFAECCAALCGKKSPQEDVVSGLEEDGCVEGLVSCADFEASMLARRWRSAPALLEEALAAGVEAWALCSISLARVAHDIAAAAAGARGRALPLLVAVRSGNGAATAPLNAAGAAEDATTKAVALVPDGPPPLFAGPDLLHDGPTDGQANGHSAGKAAHLGVLRATPGVRAWLRVCRPVALWCAAGGARGFAEKSLGDEVPSAPGAAGAQVVEALQAALAAPFSEAMVNEVWEALAELEASAMRGGDGKGADAGACRLRLVRRPCGTWAQVARDSGGLVL